MKTYHSILFDFISGFCVGIEIFTGDDLLEGDKFALTLDLGIIRVSYVISEDPPMAA